MNVVYTMHKFEISGVVFHPVLIENLRKHSMHSMQACKHSMHEVNSTKTLAVAGAKAPDTSHDASLLEGAAVEARRACIGAPPLGK